MSTPTTPRGALLRRAGTLLVAAALVGAPATSAFADPTTDAGSTASVTASASPSPTITGSPTATTTPSSDPSPTATTSPSATASPSGSATATTSPSTTATPTTPTGPSVAGKAGIAALLASAEDEAAAAFIASTLAAGGDHYVYPGGTFFDGGNTIDALVALSAVGTQQGQSDASLDYLESNLDSYIGSFGEVYAGPLAKTLLATVVTGTDPTTFGGHDLVAELQALETTKGRFSDTSAYGDYSNTIGQSLAVIALSRAGQGLNAPAVQLLLDQQCADGGFRGTIDDKGGCVSDADATAFAVQALLVASDTLICGTAAEGLTAEAAGAAGQGLDLLEDVQDPSGGFASDEGALNANTTGVAAQALTAGGRTAAADAARSFLATLQYDDTSPVALRGGIAFSADTRSSTAPSDSDLRATPQATLALAGGSLVDAVTPGVEGAAPGDTCPPAATRQPVVAPTSNPSSTVDPTSSDDPTQGAGGSDPSETVEAAPSGSLAQTGTDLALPALLGLLLVVVGGLAVWASSRRRGAHA
jgi:hypothetical protein